MELKSNKNNNQFIPKGSSLINNQLEMPSTYVERTLQINLFMQNKPNFPHFSLKNEDFTKKQTQYKANSNPIKANFGPKIRVANPNKPKFYPRFQLTLLFCRGSNTKQACPRMSQSGGQFYFFLVAKRPERALYSENTDT